jgi:hypothetical protein
MHWHCNFRYYPPQTGRRLRKNTGSLASRIEAGEEFELDWKEARPPVVSNPNQSQYFQDLCSKLSSLSGTDRQDCIATLLEASTAKVVVCSFRLCCFSHWELHGDCLPTHVASCCCAGEYFAEEFSGRVQYLFGSQLVLWGVESSSRGGCEARRLRLRAVRRPPQKNCGTAPSRVGVRCQQKTAVAEHH